MKSTIQTMGTANFGQSTTNLGTEQRIELLASQKSMTEDAQHSGKNKKRSFISCDLRCEKSYFIFSQDNFLRKICFWICYQHHSEFEYVIIVIIILGSVKLAAATFIDMDNIEVPGIDQQMYNYSEMLDLIFNIIFQIEFLIKSITMGLVIDKNSYLTDGWNKLDFIIVIASVNEMIL